ncbi:MAG: GFA family protein [Gaiellales bacterium]
MSVLLEGGCSCGEVRYRLQSEPLFTNCCHCLNCQRQTGSAFVINLLIEADRVEVLTGSPQPVDVPRDDGSVQRIFRCPTCQVAVFSEYGRPEARFVRAGTLDTPSAVAPDAHIFTRSKLAWVTLPDSVPAFEVYYDMETLWPAASLERARVAIARATPDAAATDRSTRSQ